MLIYKHHANFVDQPSNESLSSFIGWPEDYEENSIHIVIHPPDSLPPRILICVSAPDAAGGQHAHWWYVQLKQCWDY